MVAFCQSVYSLSYPQGIVRVLLLGVPSKTLGVPEKIFSPSEGLLFLKQVTEIKLLQFMNAPAPIVVTLLGIVIEVKLLQP